MAAEGPGRQSREPAYRQFLANHLNNLIMAAQGWATPRAWPRRNVSWRSSAIRDPAMVALDARLSAIIKGDQQPKDNAERLPLRAEGLRQGAARDGRPALGRGPRRPIPKLGDDRQARHRYNAACAAALAGCGKGKDDPPPDDAARAKLRQQALDWLKAELSAWKRVSMIVEPGNKELRRQTLAHWKQDADLAGIRDEPGLAKCPEAERKEWQALWADVDALRRRISDS